MKNKKDLLFFIHTGLIIIWLSACAFSQVKDMQIVREDKKADGNIGVALVIGNSAYRNARQLNSPVNDAADMGSTLKDLGFKVLKVRMDATLEEMDSAIVEFERELSENKGVGVFYYSGHGVQSYGKNYLIPIEADIPSESFLRSRSLDIDVVLGTMAKATNGFKIIILDACRTNPFAKSWSYKGRPEEGLAGISSSPKGTLIAYATSPDSIAADGKGRNSPYTEILLQEMVKPGVISEMFNNVRDILNAQTNGHQTPWESVSLIGRFCFAGCSPQVVASNANANTIDTTEKTFWREVERINTISAYEKYLSEYPTGQFAKGAKLHLSNLKWTEIKPLAQKLAKYDSISSPSEGLSLFLINEKYGFIDGNANEIIPAKYYYANSFSEGMAVVGIYYSEDCFGTRILRYGYINKLGKLVIPATYFFAFDFSQGLAGVSSDKFGFINKSNKKVTPFEYDFDLYDCVSPNLPSSLFKNDLAPVIKEIKEGKDTIVGETFGFIDKTGKLVIPLEFDYADDFSDGLALVSKNGKMGFINEQGKIAIPLQFDNAVAFYEGRASVKQNNKWQLIDRYGKIIGSLKENYEEVYEFSSGLAAVLLKGKFGFINKNGEEVVSAKYDSIWCYTFEKQGFIGVTLNGKKGFVDIYGSEYFNL